MTQLPPSAPEPTTWSEQGQAILDEFQNGRSHFIVRARAGTGKTTVGVAGVKRAPEQSILYAAFNKKIEEELARRFSGSRNVTVKTLHALGYGIVRRFWENIPCDFTSERADTLTLKVCGATAPDAIRRLVSKLHTKGREIAPHATKVGDLTNLAITFECDPDEQWALDGFDLNYIETKALAAMELAATVRPPKIDGADMLFLPVRNRWLRKSYDMVVVDEAQDMTVTMLELAQGVCKGRLVLIGDDRQAIYAFRGADAGSLDRLKAELNAKELGLTCTYRCGQVIVRRAAALVPDYEAHPSNPEGEILDLSIEKLFGDAGPGNFILSRVNAPLVSIAMKLLRAGKRTRIAGRDIGAGLKGLVRKLKGRSVPDLLTKITNWGAREAARVKAAHKGSEETLNARLEAIADQASMLASLTDGARNVDEVVDRIDALFTDDGLGDAGVITCSSIHKAKGLEADKVFVLVSTLRDFNMEEMNLQYVAITRAKSTLVMVS